MATHELLTTQRNAVLEAIVNEGLNPSDFEWRTQKSQVTPSPTYGIPYSIEVLVHVPTGSAFAFDLDAAYGHHYAVAHPGREGPTERNDAGNWPYELNYVYEWITRVNREYHTPDLWAEIYDRNELLALESDEAKNTPFSADEQTEIAGQLREIKEYVRATYNLSDEQHRVLDARLGYLEGAARRGVGRIDWRNAFVG